MKFRMKHLTKLMACVAIIFATACSDDDEAPELKKIVLDKSNINMVVGDITNLQMNCSPKEISGEDFIWTSSDETVATVATTSGIVITAIAEGETTIKVQAENGIFAICNVTVALKDPTSLNIVEPETTEVETGMELELEAKILPVDANKLVVWESSDSKIATVDNGKVNFLREGKVTIKATSINDIEDVINFDVIKAPFRIPTEMVGFYTAVDVRLYNESTQKMLITDEELQTVISEGHSVAEFKAGAMSEYTYEAFDDNTIGWNIRVSNDGGQTVINKTLPGVILPVPLSTTQFTAKIDHEGINLSHEFNANQPMEHFGDRKVSIGFKISTIDYLVIHVVYEVTDEKPSSYNAPMLNNLKLEDLLK